MEDGSVSPGLRASDAKKPGMLIRLDARDKISGRTRYVADLEVPGMCHAAIVRSSVPHAAIRSVETAPAKTLDGVIGVFTAADMTSRLHGRAVKDVPVLARERARFVGEPVAVVVAESRRTAERASRLVDVTYQPLPFVSTIDEALAPDAPRVHDAPWEHRNAVTDPSAHANLQSASTWGRQDEALTALADCAHVVDLGFTTPGGHHGYLEAQACIASFEDGRVRIWLTNKAPYPLREQLADALDLSPGNIEVMPVPIGGDFGGKGSLQQAPLCVELSRLVERPVKLVLRYDEDLVATNPRHPSRIRVRFGCMPDGRLGAGHVEVALNGGAYAGFKPRSSVDLGGVATALHPYDIASLYLSSRIVYTHTVPRGHMRSPGHPQTSFAVESALDELATVAGLDAVELRRRNVLEPGRKAFDGTTWGPARGRQVLDAVARVGPVQPARSVTGWRLGRGVALCMRTSAERVETSLRLVRTPAGRIRAEVPLVETGTGNHSVLRDLLSEAIAVPAELIDVVHVSTDQLPTDAGVGHSRVTMGIAAAMREVAARWREHDTDEPLLVELTGPTVEDGRPPAAYCAQLADVAVDPDTGQIEVLAITSVLDVGRIVDERAHQMQVDGGTVMGLGFALTEDLRESGGRVWAGDLGEFRLPTSDDVPELVTVHVRDPSDDHAVVKPIGELTNVAVAAAIANAVRAATGVRLTELPLRAECVFRRLHEWDAT